MVHNFKDLSGKKYGRLLVVKMSSLKRGSVLWNCLCECGKNKDVTTSALNSGNTSSCGCMRNAHKKILKHGEGKCVTKEYRAWADMKNRCYSSSSKIYKFYGGRGISVCEKWISSYEIFLQDMGRAPTVKHSLDRFPDKNGNYEPRNCRWATPKEQQNNIRSNVFVEYNGESLTKAQWRSRLRINKSTFLYYLKKGFTIGQIEVIKKSNKLKDVI